MEEATLTRSRPCPHAPYGGAFQQHSWVGAPVSLHDHAEDPQTCGPPPSCPCWASTALHAAQKRGRLLSASRPSLPAVGALLSAPARTASLCPRAPMRALYPVPSHSSPGGCGLLVPSRCTRSASGPHPLPGQAHPQGTTGASNSVPLIRSPHTEAEPLVPRERRSCLHETQGTQACLPHGEGSAGTRAQQTVPICPVERLPSTDTSPPG